MKILMVSPVPLFPCNAGNRARVKELARAIQLLGHDLHFVFVALPESPEHADELAHKEFFGSDHVTWLTLNDGLATATRFFQRARRRIGTALGLRPRYVIHVDEWFVARYLEELRKLHTRFQFGAVMVEYVFASKAFEAFGEEVRKILDTHDIFANRHQYYLARGRTPGWFSTTVAEENAALRRADSVLAIQESEAHELRSRLGIDAGKVAVVSHFLDVGRSEATSNGAAAGFLASANPINIDAIRYFVSDILDRVVERYPDFMLYVAGSVCNCIDDHPRMKKLGFIDRSEQIFEKISVFINPVLMGTGINIKLLEALARGVPVVTTLTGARGLEKIGAGVVAVPDDDVDGFATAVSSILLSPASEAREAALGFAKAWDTRQREELAKVLPNDPG